MKRPAYILPFVLAFAISMAAAIGIRAEVPDTLADEVPGESSDSIPRMRSASKESDQQSFFNGVIPPSPNAAALARYAEYPVSHTTGIPDITIPIYTIDLGGFQLPISISYHASGCRVDEVPTCVGLGWCLNAGGAVTRTILGAPDWYKKTVDTENYSYRDYKYMRNLIYGNPSNEWPLKAFISHNPEYDTESDRYCLNAGGHSFVFRYSHNDRKFIVLNHENCSIRYFGCDRDSDGSSFLVRFPDGLEWTFGAMERTGVDATGEAVPYTTAWYATKIRTPYGNIDISYREGTILKHDRIDYSLTMGPTVDRDADGNPVLEKNRMDSGESMYTYYYGQTLVDSISWNGNRILFDYSCPHPNHTTDRLERITVVNRNGDTVKTVNFGNDYFWPSNLYFHNESDCGRRQLTRLEDSQAGTYTFEYDNRINLPPLEHLSPQSWSDLFGYFRGVGGSLFTQKVIDRLYDIFGPGLAGFHKPAAADRRSVKEGITNGMLKKITFPTGGHTVFAYGANTSDDYNTSGIHLDSMTMTEGDETRTWSYKYIGDFAQVDPEELMVCQSAELVADLAEHGLSYTRLKAYASPFNSPYQTSAPMAYHLVQETLPDGSIVLYQYNRAEMTEQFGYNYSIHPSHCDNSTIDIGSHLPQLEFRSIWDCDSNLVYREEILYNRNNRHKEFDTGVRCTSEYILYNFDTAKDSDIWGWNILSSGGFDMSRTIARARTATVKEKKVTDYRTGVVTTTSYTYDDSLRTTKPKTVTVTDSSCRKHVTEYTYPFERVDSESREMTSAGVTDLPVAVMTTVDGVTVSANETEYVFNDTDNDQEVGFYIPAVIKSWSMPTKDCIVAVPSVLPEREKVSEYNSLGRPISIIVNETDSSAFTWSATGDLLLSSTAPVGLTTTYTHKPLFGLATTTRPNGLKTRYEYNSIGFLSHVYDNLGCLDTYSYSIANHPDVNYNSKGNSVISRHYLTQDGLVRTIDQQFYDGLGRPSVLAKDGGNTSEKYLYSAVTYDKLGRELRNIMQAVGSTAIEKKTAAQVLAMSAGTYGDAYAYSESTYDGLGNPVKMTTPGQAWHDAGEKGKVTEYVGNAASSVRLYSAPMGTISLVENGYYAASTLHGVRTVDEDGNEMTVYTDRLGRKVLERRGPESAKGKNDTYFVYNDLGQLRYVLSPGYELSGYKDMFAYEYRYDEHGNVVKKFIPGGGYTQFWYDRTGRMTFMQDENLRGQNLHRFFIYDRAGRQALQGTTAMCNRSSTVNFADYTGGTSGFQSTGYTLQDASRIQQVTLETVNYHDDYRFASSLDSRLVQSTSVSAKGLGTGSVTYNSEGGKSMSAIYYDIRGNVTSLREITDFGTLRVTDNTYTFTNQPLTTRMTESGGVTMLTENTYDTGSGLLVATDVTVNGVKQRVSKVTYDDLGRIASVVRGNGANSGGTVSYAYNLHGQTTSISGPGFTQKLHYTDGPGKPLYNGSVSSMLWTMGSDATQRGYRYTYNGYNWLTLAEYGEGSTLSSHKDRYTERFSEFMLNGGIRRLQRHGLKADGNYGKIDNLHISYYGNRISTVLEDADPVTQSGSMDYPGAKKEMSFGYNVWGALVSDESRGIESVEYDNFGNPVYFDLKGRDYTKNVYSATGVKLKTTHYTDPVAVKPPISMETPLSAAGPENTAAAVGPFEPGTQLMAGMEKLEYHGPAIYRNGKIDMVLFPGGYATVDTDKSVTFHYYTQDYLGNNRAVVNGSTGAIEQTTAYYPYGAVITDISTDNTNQPFKYGGKELVSANGLNMYDFGARLHYPAIPQFDRVDPLCETYTWLSPYLYCANNPVNAFDPDGRSTWVTDLGDGKYQVIGGDLNDKDLNVYVYTKDENGNNTVRGRSIGITATMFSFYNSGDEGDGPPGWNDKSIIDMNDNSGAEFLSDLASSNPPLASDYIPNAKNNMQYDFKATNGTSEKIDGIDHYRGMQIGKTENGVPILASARDVGNIGAGYMVAVNGFTWNEARAGFDAYQSKGKRDQKTEGVSTQTAQWYGYRMGRRSTSFCQRTYNKARSFIDAVVVGIKRYTPFLK